MPITIRYLAATPTPAAIARAKKWRDEGFGRLSPPQLGPRPSCQERLIQKFWRDPNLKEQPTQCLVCAYAQDFDFPDDVEGTEPEECLRCGCSVKDSIAMEFLHEFGLFLPDDNVDQINAVKHFIELGISYGRILHNTLMALTGKTGENDEFDVDQAVCHLKKLGRTSDFFQ